MINYNNMKDVSNMIESSLTIRSHVETNFVNVTKGIDKKITDDKIKNIVELKQKREKISKKITIGVY